MANANEFAGGEYLKPADITEPVKAKIERCFKSTDFDGNPCLCLDLDVDGESKRLQLNRTKVKKMIELHGEDYDKWSDKFIGLNPAEYEYKGSTGATIEIVQEDDLPF